MSHKIKLSTSTTRQPTAIAISIRVRARWLSYVVIMSLERSDGCRVDRHAGRQANRSVGCGANTLPRNSFNDRIKHKNMQLGCVCVCESVKVFSSVLLSAFFSFCILLLFLSLILLSTSMVNISIAIAACTAADVVGVVVISLANVDNVLTIAGFQGLK